MNNKIILGDDIFFLVFFKFVNIGLFVVFVFFLKYDVYIVFCVLLEEWIEW